MMHNYKTVKKFHLRKDILVDPSTQNNQPPTIYSVPETTMLEILQYQVIGISNHIQNATLELDFSYQFYDGETLIEEYINPKPYNSELLIDQSMTFYKEVKIKFPNLISTIGGVKVGSFIVTVILIGNLYEIGYEATPDISDEFIDRVDIETKTKKFEVSQILPGDRY